MKHTKSSILSISVLLLLASTVCATTLAQTPADNSLSSSSLTITAQYLYASGRSSSGNGLIAGFRVGAGGKLTYTGQAFPVREAPLRLLQSARGAKLFAASGTSIWSFAVTPTTGILRLITVVRLPANQFLTGMAINPQSTLLFVAKLIDRSTPNEVSRITTYRIASTGVLTPIASLRIAPTENGLAVDPAGKFLYAATGIGATLGSSAGASIAQFAINPTTGSLTFKSRVSPSDLSFANEGELVMHPTGRFLYFGLGIAPFVSVFSINSVTGALTSIQFQRCDCDLGPEFGGRSVMDPRGTVLFSGTSTDAGVAVYTINTSTGLLTPVPDSFQGLVIASPFMVDGTGKFLYVAVPDLSKTLLHGFAVADSGVLTPLANAPSSVPSTMAEVITLGVVSVRQ